jgi:hypothetical protein
VLANGALFDGRRRRLLILFAYAKLLSLLEGSDQALVRALQAEVDGDVELHGVWDVPEDEIRSWLSRLAPATPAGFELVGSRPLLDQVEELIKRSCRDVPELAERAEEVRLEPLCFDYAAPPGFHEEHSIDEWILLTALYAEVDLVISDQGPVGAGGEAVYKTSDGRSVRVMTLNHFVTHELGEFDLESLDPALLAEACWLLQHRRPRAQLP